MKKAAFIIVALVLAAMVAVPAMAITPEFEGTFRVRGFNNTHSQLDENDSSDAWMDQRFRLQTRFRVTDNLVFTTRFDAVEKTWGTPDMGSTSMVGNAVPYKVTDGNGVDLSSGTPFAMYNYGGSLPIVYQKTGTENVDFEHAYMSITTSFGKFDVGRMSAFAWGTSFADSEDAADRIKWTLPLNDQIILLAIYQKNVEADKDSGYTDSDSDTYYLAGIYKMEQVTLGLLGAYTTVKTNSDTMYPFGNLGTFPSGVGSATFVPVGPAGQINTHPRDTQMYSILPYFQGKYGDIRFQGELRYNFGKAADFDRDVYAAMNPTVLEDVDFDSYGWNLEVGYDWNAFNFEAGYTWMSGDDGSDAGEATGFGGPGADWEKLWILTSTSQGIESTLGGMGNLTEGAAAMAGGKIFYLGAGFSPLEDLTLKVLYGHAKAESPLQGWSQDYGSEYDFFLTWNIWDNLTYQFIAAYLDAGDFWQAGNPDNKLENAYSLFQKLELSF